MDKFYLNPKSLYEMLKEKGVEYLYHANTVLTSKTFIQNRALLSRAYVEDNNLIQTDQNSDLDDKQHGVWDDIFLDGFDLHKKYSRPNNYGPVLFVLKLELLLSQSISKILITKNNPWYWGHNDELENRYYNNIDDVKKDYLTGRKIDARIMFTIRKPQTNIKLNKYLKFIGIDKPNILINFTSHKKNLGDLVLENISETMKLNGLGHIPVIHRQHRRVINTCTCNLKYSYLFNRNYQELKKRFRINP